MVVRDKPSRSREHKTNSERNCDAFGCVFHGRRIAPGKSNLDSCLCNPQPLWPNLYQTFMQSCSAESLKEEPTRSSSNQVVVVPAERNNEQEAHYGADENECDGLRSIGRADNRQRCECEYQTCYKLELLSSTPRGCFARCSNGRELDLRRVVNCKLEPHF